MISMIPDRDIYGRQVVRNATTDKGWSYLADCIDVETSKINGFFHQDYQGNSTGMIDCKLYDANNNLITDAQYENTAVKTVITFNPDHDFDIISGSIHQSTKATDNVRIWTIGGILALGNAGTREFVRGLNLKHFEQAKTDGRSSKMLFHEHNVEGLGTFEGDFIQFIIKYPQGHSHDLMLMVEYYRL